MTAERTSWRSAAGEIRFEQGGGPAFDAATLVEMVRSDLPLTVVAPVRVPLEWTEGMARRWACDCVEHVLAPFGDPDEGEARLVHNAVVVARGYADGRISTDMIDAILVELQVEEWPDEGALHHAAAAASYAVARDKMAETRYGDFIVPGRWATSAASEAARVAAEWALESHGDEAAGERAARAAFDAERSWQRERLLDYLSGKIR